MMQCEETQPSHETKDNHQSKGRQFFGGFSTEDLKRLQNKQGNVCVAHQTRLQRLTAKPY